MEQEFPSLIASKEDRKIYYNLTKKWGGFTPDERRFVWLQVTGAQMAMTTSNDSLG